MPKQHLIDMYGIIVSVSKPNHFRFNTRYTLIRRLHIERDSQFQANRALALLLDGNQCVSQFDVLTVQVAYND